MKSVSLSKRLSWLPNQLGLGTVPIGDVRKNALEIVHELQLPEYVFPMLGLCIGYPRRRTGIKASFSTTGCLFEETYKTDLKR